MPCASKTRSGSTPVILLASATATTLRGRPPSGSFVQGVPRCFPSGGPQYKRNPRCQLTPRAGQLHRTNIRSRGYSPSQAAKCRADLNNFGSVTDATKADAVMMPMLGNVLSKLLTSFRWRQRMSCLSMVVSFTCDSCIRQARFASTSRATSGSPSSSCGANSLTARTA